MLRNNVSKLCFVEQVARLIGQTRYNLELVISGFTLHEIIPITLAENLAA